MVVQLLPSEWLCLTAKSVLVVFMFDNQRDREWGRECHPEPVFSSSRSLPPLKHYYKSVNKNVSDFRGSELQLRPEWQLLRKSPKSPGSRQHWKAHSLLFFPFSGARLFLCSHFGQTEKTLHWYFNNVLMQVSLIAPILSLIQIECTFSLFDKSAGN